MSEPFTVDIERLDYPKPRERQVQIWCEIIRAKMAVPPIKVIPKSDPPGRWIVISGAVAVEAARREGMTAIACEAI